MQNSTAAVQFKYGSSDLFITGCMPLKYSLVLLFQPRLPPRGGRPDSKRAVALLDFKVHPVDIRGQGHVERAAVVTFAGIVAWDTDERGWG